MNDAQKDRVAKLEDELGIVRGTLPIQGESEGYVFTEVDGVTVLITKRFHNPRDGYKLAAVSTYDEVVNPTNLDAAKNAKILFSQQGRGNRKYGHRGSVVGLNWKCGDALCQCNGEPYERRVARAIGHDISVQGHD